MSCINVLFFLQQADWDWKMSALHWWHHGAVSRASDLWSRGHGFESQLGTQRKHFGQVSYTYVPLTSISTSWYWLNGGDTRTHYGWQTTFKSHPGQTLNYKGQYCNPMTSMMIIITLKSANLYSTPSSIIFSVLYVLVLSRRKEEKIVFISVTILTYLTRKPGSWGHSNHHPYTTSYWWPVATLAPSCTVRAILTHVCHKSEFSIHHLHWQIHLRWSLSSLCNKIDALLFRLLDNGNTAMLWP